MVRRRELNLGNVGGQKRFLRQFYPGFGGKFVLKSVVGIESR